jgi:hypothetical protein
VRDQSVYLIGSYDVRPVKIGVSENPEKRLKSLSTGSPVPLQLLWSAPGGAALEAALHEYFQPYRVYGEWFDFGDEDPVQLVVAAAARMGHGHWPIRCDGPPESNAVQTVATSDNKPVVEDISIPELLLIYPPEVVSWHASKTLPISSDRKKEAHDSMIRWLKTQVEASQLNQSEAAALFGVNPSTISRWLSSAS